MKSKVSPVEDLLAIVQAAIKARSEAEETLEAFACAGRFLKVAYPDREGEIEKLCLRAEEILKW